MEISLDVSDAIAVMAYGTEEDFTFYQHVISQQTPFLQKLICGNKTVRQVFDRDYIECQKHGLHAYHLEYQGQRIGIAGLRPVSQRDGDVHIGELWVFTMRRTGKPLLYALATIFTDGFTKTSMQHMLCKVHASNELAIIGCKRIGMRQVYSWYTNIADHVFFKMDKWDFEMVMAFSSMVDSKFIAESPM
jgi:hypothetical protein